MKRFLLALILFVSTFARADITAEHFSFSQVFDVQWYISGGVLHASGFNYLYASVNASGQLQAGRLSSTQTATYANAGDYIAFFHSTTNPGTYGLGVYDTNNNLVRILDNTGVFTALADGAIFYNGNGSWGTLFTTKQGYSINGSGTFTVQVSNPTNSYMASYNPPNTQPLAAGQTASSSPTVTGTSNSTIITTTTSGATVNTYSQPVTITTYSDGSTTTANNGSATLLSSVTTGGGGTITTGQQSDVSTFNNRVISGASIYIQQSGNHDNINIQQIGSSNTIGGVNQQSALIQNGSNTITIKQGQGNMGKNEIDLSVTGGSNTVNLVQAYDIIGTSAGNNYQLININGPNNSVMTSQTNNGGLAGHFLEVAVSGSANTITSVQSNNTQKQAFISVTGNGNSVSSTQSGLGAHYLNVTETGNGNSATVLQTNTGATGANTSTINLINAGAPASVNLTQTGGQGYSVTQTCYTTACGTITLRQGN